MREQKELEVLQWLNNWEEADINQGCDLYEHFKKNRFHAANMRKRKAREDIKYHLTVISRSFKSQLVDIVKPNAVDKYEVEEGRLEPAPTEGLSEENAAIVTEMDEKWKALYKELGHLKSTLTEKSKELLEDKGDEADIQSDELKTISEEMDALFAQISWYWEKIAEIQFSNKAEGELTPPKVLQFTTSDDEFDAEQYRADLLTISASDLAKTIGNLRSNISRNKNKPEKAEIYRNRLAIAEEVLASIEKA